MNHQFDYHQPIEDIVFDISNCREGDYECFGKLQKLMNDPIIQKAFFLRL